MRVFFSIIVLAALAAPNSSAVIDPDPDGIGIYFDLDAEVFHSWVEPMVLFDAYVMLTNPSVPDIQGFAMAEPTASVPEGMENHIFRLGSYIPNYNGDDWSPPDGNVIVSFAQTVPLSNPYILMRMTYIVLDPVEIEFFVGPTIGDDPYQGWLAYFSEEGIIPMFPSSGDCLLPVAMVNMEGVVPTTEASFGSLKALFR